MGRLSGDDDTPDDDGPIEASGLRDYIYGPLDTKATQIRDLLDTALDRLDSLNQNVATLTASMTDTDRAELSPEPREFPHAIEVEVPADTGVTDPATARFEPAYDATITTVDIEFPEGTQQAVGVQLRTAGNEIWIPRGGTQKFAGQDPDQIQYVQANDRTISAPLNVEVNANSPIVAEFVSNDPVNNHLIEITLNLRERTLGDA